MLVLIISHPVKYIVRWTGWCYTDQNKKTTRTHSDVCVLQLRFLVCRVLVCMTRLPSSSSSAHFAPDFAWFIPTHGMATLRDENSLQRGRPGMPAFSLWSRDCFIKTWLPTDVSWCSLRETLSQTDSLAASQDVALRLSGQPGVYEAVSRLNPDDEKNDSKPNLRSLR